MTENDQAWQLVFDALNLRAALQAEGRCYVTADELKAHGKREPRLMAKMDTLHDRPQVFREQEVNLFPVKNGRYVLFRDPENKTYFRFGASLESLTARNYPASVDLNQFDTFPRGNQLSESQAIDFAFLSGLLPHFFGDAQARLTVRGRLFSEPFGFQPPAGEARIEVSRVQIELDAGYESPDRLFLLEAKVGKRDDFNIRQLYYPFLNWSARSRKKIVPIFLTYTNGQYFLTEFAFSPRFGELGIVRSECYTINDSPFAEIDWARLLRETPVEAEATPFPQADDMDKVVDLVRLLPAGLSDKAQFAESFEFDERQGDYYANAAKYLGLVEREGKGFQLTSLGEAFCRTTSRADRTLCLVKQLLKRPAFRRLIELLARRNLMLASLPEAEVAGLIAQDAALSPSTAARRALTARTWLTWILKNSWSVT
jgi:hypothetical protein